MSKFNDGKVSAETARRTGSKRTWIIVGIGVALLMAFSIAVSQWASNPGLSVLAGTAAISIVVWVIRQIVTSEFPARERGNGSESQHQSEVDDTPSSAEVPQ